MQYKVTKCTTKAPDWKVIDIEMGPDSVQADVSVNRVNKKGEVFPDFDGIAAGATVAGELWQSTAGKYYLFAPRVAAPRAPGGGNRTGQIREAQEFKTASIQRSQEVSQLGMKIAAAMRDATSVTLAALRDTPFPTNEEFKDEWRRWRDFFVNEFDSEREQRDK